MKKILLVIALCIVLACSGCENNSNVEKNKNDISKVYEEEKECEDNMGFDAETIQMDVVPQIELKDSLPYEPIKIIFNISFVNGDFEIVSYDIEKLNLQN